SFTHLDPACLVEDPETKKQRPRNYLETLEERLALLENQASENRFTDSNSSTPVLQSSNGGDHSVPAFASEVGDVVHSGLPVRVGELDVSTTQTEPQYLGSSSAFAFSHLISSSLRGAIVPKPSSRTNPGHLCISPLPCPLPGYGIATTLSNAYFENIHPQYPFLHEPTFRQYEKNLLAACPDTTDLGVATAPFFFMHMWLTKYFKGICSGCNLGSRLSALSRDDPEEEKQHYSAAQLYPDVLSYNNLEAIQAILCYAMYSLRSPTGPSLWKLSGLALRQCIELGYHRSARRVRSVQDALQLELRKRSFWCAQGIDVTYALRLGRPLGIQVHEIDAELPLDIDDASISSSGILGIPRTSPDTAPTSMSNALHVIRLRRIWARIHTCVYSTSMLGDVDDNTRNSHILQLREDLEEWRRTAPEPPPRSGKPLSIFSTKAWYDLNYSGTILNLYRNQLVEPENTPDSVFLDCMQAASTVCRLYRRQYVGTSIQHTWATLHCVFWAGLIFLHCLWTSNAACESVQHGDVSQICTDCIMVLVVIAQAWEEAAPYRDIFEVLTNRTLSMIVNRNLQRPPVPATPALSATSEREAVARWMTEIDDTGMLSGLDEFLSGFMDNLGGYNMTHDDNV
ncbi:unnamed protein product, partial [Clonostachys solani]